MTKMCSGVLSTVFEDAAFVRTQGAVGRIGLSTVA